MFHKMHLFVYGTLKNNIRNSSTFTGMKYIGNAKTKDKYIMYAFQVEENELSAPFVNTIGESNELIHINGELYDVDDETLILIDEREGSPGWYDRVSIQVMLDGKSTNTFMYINNKVFKNMDYKSWGYSQPIVIKDGNYSKYTI
jgi:gamma-glutamylcyclotransferase (GGCT)/AIG2-like uncharacterized protein YtfP